MAWDQKLGTRMILVEQLEKSTTNFHSLLVISLHCGFLKVGAHFTPTLHL